MFDLRPYQVEPYEAGIKFFQQEEPKPGIIVAPTAFGKSILIAHLVNNIEGKTLVLQPRKEILKQNFSKFISLGGYASIYSASMDQKRFSNTVYATIGSIKNLGKSFKSLGFKNIIIDEVHLYPRDVMAENDQESKSMLATFLYESGIKKVLGLTATPFKLQSNTDMNGERFSKLQMLTSRSKKGQFFKEILHVTQIQEIVSLGFWSKLEYEIHEFNDRHLEYNTVKSDYTDESMRFSYDSQHIEDKIVERVQQLDRNSVIIFVPTIESAESIARKLPGCYAVHSKLKDEVRDNIIDGFKAGKIRYVVNVDIISVGFDHTKVDCIVSGRSTASLGWLYQALGRGTRIDPEKEDCLIIDFAGNIKKFGRIEYIYFKKKNSWQIYGEGGKLLTGIAMHQIGSVVDGPTSGIVLEFGKFKGKDINAVPAHYLDWMLKNFTWTDKNFHIKEAAEKIVNG